MAISPCINHDNFTVNIYEPMINPPSFLVINLSIVLRTPPAPRRCRAVGWRVGKATGFARRGDFAGKMLGNSRIFLIYKSGRRKGNFIEDLAVICCDFKRLEHGKRIEPNGEIPENHAGFMEHLMEKPSFHEVLRTTFENVR